MELMGHEDSEFDEQIILQKIRTYVLRIKLDDEKPLELTFSTREFSDQWSYFQYPSTLHTNILGEILKFQEKWLTYKIENKYWSSAFLMKPDEPLISKIKKFYHDELPSWPKLFAYVCKGEAFEEYSARQRFEFCLTNLKRLSLHILESLLFFYDQISKDMCKRDRFLAMRMKLEEVVNYQKLLMPSSEMLLSVKSMKGIKLLIEKTIPSNLRFIEKS